MKLAILVLCGLSAVLGAPSELGNRIVGGRPAPNGGFPYQVSLRRNGNHFCGGSIINQNTILTAAHCLDGSSPQGLQVVVGTNYLNSGGVAYNAVSLSIHPSYNPQQIINDVAIVKVSPAIQYNQVVQPVSLASSNPQHGSTLTLSGWGLTSYPGNIPNDLQMINLQTLDINQCAAAGMPSPITNGQVCTTSPPNQGACQGDSGGPLVDQSGVQVGVVSWGVPCARGKPDVFTSVAFYNSWIRQNM